MRSPSRPRTGANLPPLSRATPPPCVPTQSAPLSPGQRAVTESLMSPRVLFFLNTVNWPPSKQARPPSLPIHRRPSPAWARA